jgi:CRISPR-associated protein Cas1
MPCCAEPLRAGWWPMACIPPSVWPHNSEQNAFNLADDLIEPFRPLVDLHVTQHGRHEKGN